jgi:hypothetical protein
MHLFIAKLLASSEPKYVRLKRRKVINLPNKRKTPTVQA